MFFDRFKELCQEKGVSVYKACTDIGLNRSAVNKWKHGGQPNGTTLACFAKYFGVSVDYLVGNVSDPFFHLDADRILADINSYETENVPTLAEKDRHTRIAKKMNYLRIVGRDGSCEERFLTDGQLAAVRAIISQLPDATEDL